MFVVPRFPPGNVVWNGSWWNYTLVKCTIRIAYYVLYQFTLLYFCWVLSVCTYQIWGGWTCHAGKHERLNNHQPASPEECPTCLHVPKLVPTMLWFTQNKIHLGLCHIQWDNQIITAYLNKRIIQNWESQWSDIFRRHVEIRKIPTHVLWFWFLTKEAIFFLHKEMQMYIFCVVFSE